MNYLRNGTAPNECPKKENEIQMYNKIVIASKGNNNTIVMSREE